MNRKKIKLWPVIAILMVVFVACKNPETTAHSPANWDCGRFGSMHLSRHMEGIYTAIQE